MPFPLSGPAMWPSQEPQRLWAWSSQARDTRAGGQPLPKGMGASLFPCRQGTVARLESKGRARLPPLDLGTCVRQHFPEALTVEVDLCRGLYAGWQAGSPLGLPHVCVLLLPWPLLSCAGEGLLGHSSFLTQTQPDIVCGTGS
jgi:hypothetical protein